MERKSSQSLKVSLSFPERWFCISRPNLTLERLEPIFSGSEDSIYAFQRLQNKFIENPDILRNFPGMFSVCFAFPEKWFCIPRANFAFFSLLPTFSRTEDLIQAFSRLQSKFIGNSNMEKKSSQSFKASLAFPEKWFGIR